MPRIPLSRTCSLEIRRVGWELRFSIHNGKGFVSPAYKLDRDAYFKIMSRKPTALSEEMTKRVEVELSDRGGYLDVVLDGSHCGGAEWHDWVKACREAWGGSPFEDRR